MMFMLQTLCSEIENQDIEAFTQAVKQYDSISRLDAWYTTLLLRYDTGRGVVNFSPTVCFQG